MESIRNLFSIILLVGLIAIGAFLGYAIGDVILGATDYARPQDVLEYRAGSPIVGGIIGLVLGLRVVSGWKTKKA